MPLLLHFTCRKQRISACFLRPILADAGTVCTSIYCGFLFWVSILALTYFARGLKTLRVLVTLVTPLLGYFDVSRTLVLFIRYGSKFFIP